MISRKVREGIEYHFSKLSGTIPRVELKTPDIVVEAHLFQNRITLSLNSGGKSLHRRGYRLATQHPAPIKETLAAALVKLAGYKGDTVFLDPFCGSGTIAIEAAMIAMQKACNLDRKKEDFGLENFKDFDESLWQKIQKDLQKEKLTKIKFPIYASDIEGSYVSEAKQTSTRAQVERNIQFSRASFFALKKPAETGIIIANLPYGERLENNDEDFKNFYQGIGDHLKKNFSGWKACFLVNQDSPWKFIGLRPSKKYSILNGSIAAKFLVFELFEGSRKKKNIEIKASK